ncbi:FliH/SctL family protein [Azospirillum halopraeferens]|uniref:FliH/SctL family protein n=1 Tax=Azospirillum halopraeferens TaxID=34010 RepID=UPI0003F83392|nr:FliH/SctL family protein [Azospirillum halopraeferens]
MAYPRYSFDRAFGAPGADPAAAPEPEPVDPLDEPRHSERVLLAAVDEARRVALAEGLERGRRDGEAVARTGAEAALADGVAALLERAAALEADHRVLLDRLESRGAALLVALAGRLAPRLLDTAARDAVERTAREALNAAGGAPELHLRVHPALRDVLDETIREAVAETGYRGGITVVSDDALARGALDAVWDAGGLRRDPAAMERALDALVERTLGALAAGDAD